MLVRQGKRLPCREYDDMLVRAGFDMSDDEMRTFLDNDGVILCAYNNTRRRLNARRSANPRLQRCAAGNRREAGLHLGTRTNMES
ncbi:hypothetical protein WP1_167 [Pseudomonas phage WP1]